MAWTTPRTWVTNEVVTAAIMNQYIRDNQVSLKDPPFAQYVLNEGADYTTTSTSFVNVDATDLALSITTAGGVVEIHFHGIVTNSSTAFNNFDVEIDGSPYAGDDGITSGVVSAGVKEQISFTVRKSGLSAGSHTFKLQWKTNTGTATLYAGAGTSGYDQHGEFWVVER